MASSASPAAACPSPPNCWPLWSSEPYAARLLLPIPPDGHYTNLRQGLTMSGAKVRVIVAGTALLSALVPYLHGQVDRNFIGKVVMEDGSPPPKAVILERVCGGRS